MTARMFLVVQADEVTDESSRELQRALRELDALLLMATRSGPLVLLDEEDVARVEAHPLVAFVGAVELNPHGVAADRLERIFVENLSRQIDPQALSAVNAVGKATRRE